MILAVQEILKEKVLKQMVIDRELGLKRLGRIIRLSRERQGLSMIDFSNITRKIFNGEGINPNTISNIERNNVLNPEDFTLFRLAPLTLIVTHLEISKDDPVGRPYFKFERDFLALENLQLRQANDIENFPHLEYRYKRVKDLWAIVEGKLPIKQLSRSR